MKNKTAAAAIHRCLFSPIIQYFFFQKYKNYEKQLFINVKI
jgi:hypothetical protein